MNMNEPTKTVAVNLERIKKNFWRKVDKNGPIPKHCPELGSCWNWLGAKNWTGYACMTVKGWHEQRANRVSWRLHRGDIPDGIKVLHKCDNRQCTNPDHLFLGTQRDNIVDMFQKGRKDNTGTHNARAKLTESDVIEIRRLLAVKEITQAEMARRFKISEGMIGFIKRGESWTHIKPVAVEPAVLRQGA